MNETPERPGFYEEDFYAVPEQREDPNEEERRESIEEAERFAKSVTDGLLSELPRIVHPDPRYVHTRHQAD